MTDAASTLKLGIDTGTGKTDVVSLRQEFTKLREEVLALNDLKANAQGLTSGSKSAQNELATLSAELKSSVARVGELEQQLAKLGKSQEAAAKAATATVTAESKKQFDVQVTTANNIAAEIKAAEEKATKAVKEEAAKRYSITQSARSGGLNYSMRDSSNAGDFSNALKDAERVRREVLANSQSMIIAEADRADAIRREKSATAQAMLIAETERSESLRREKLSTSQAMLIAETERAEARRREVLATSQVMQMAEIDRADAMRREKLAVSQAMQIAEIERAEAVKREKNAAAQAMLIAEIDRAEARKIEIARVAREMQIAEIDRAEQTRREKQRTANEMLIAEVERTEQRKSEILRNAREMQMAEIERADQLRLQRQRTANDMLIADTKRAEEERQLLMNSKFQAATPGSKVTTVRSAAALYGDGTDQRRVTLANSRYGSEAVGNIGNLTQLEAAAAAATRASTQATLQNAAARREATAMNRAYGDSLNEVHSGVRGLAGGLGQLWATWGSVIPLVAGAAVTGSMVKVFQAGKDVEYQLQFLRALSDDLSKKPIDLDSFLRITDGTMSSVKEAAEGMRALSQAGLNQREALIALPDILDLAAVGEMKVGQAALTATGVVNAFNLSLSEIGHVGDVFARIAASSNTSVISMTESMKQASTVGEMFHVKLEQAAATMGVLAQRNIMGSAAGTALTTALKNLYEPTAKAKAALDELNITTNDGKGGLKDYTQLFMDLREKVFSLNEAGQAVFLGTISDQRGAKAISAMMHNMDEYKKFLDDAKNSSQFMSKATLELEDTVQGSMQRMANAVDSTFNKAFKAAEPEIRSVIASMRELASNEDAVSLLTRLSIAAARLTGLIVDNAGKIALFAGFFVAAKAVSGLTNAIVGARVAMEAQRLTTVASTAASGANAVALTIEQQAMANVGRTSLLAAAGTRALAASLGPITALIMVGVTAWELFAAKVDEGTEAQKRSKNTLDTVLDYYDRQTEKLKAINQELREKNRLERDGDEGNKGKNGSAIATSQEVLLKQLRAQEDKIKGLRVNAAKGPTMADMMAQGEYGGPVKTQAQQELEDAEKRRNEIMADIEKLGQKGFNYKAELKDKDRLTTRDNMAQQLKSMLEEAQHGGKATSDIATDIRKALGKVRDDDGSYAKMQPAVDELRDRLNKARKDYTPPNSKGESDAYRAKQAELDGEIQRIKDEEKSKLANVKTQLATHEIGELQAVAMNLEIVKKARQDELGVIQRKEDLAKDNGKLTGEQQASNRAAAARRADLEADSEASRQRNEIASKWSQEDLKIEADRLRKRGELVKAFQAEFDAKNGGELRSLEKDIASPDVSLLDSVRASRRVDTLNNQRDTGTQVSSFDELQDQYDQLVNRMEEKLARVAEKASQTNGFLANVGAAQAGDEIRDQMLPQIDAVVQRMGGIATALNDNGMKASVSKMSANMIKEADRSRAAWVSAGRSIASALSESFGKGGKAAGGIVDALVKQRAAQKDIESDLAKNKKDDPIKAMELEDKARQDSAKLQISSYGEIAGAAKGFFDEHSKGYAAMQAAEQVFRAFELAMAIQNFVKKTFFATAEKTTVIAAEGEKAAATVAGASVSVSASMAEGTASAAAGVAGQAKGDPYSAWVRMAAMAAAMAAIGFAVGGGSSAPQVDISKERQKYAGTGYTYDPNSNANPYDWELQKSDSLTKAMESLKDNSDIALTFSSSQLKQLENISDGISGLSNSIIQTTGIRGTRADELAAGVSSSHGFLGFSGSSTSLTDAGIAFGSQQDAKQLAFFQKYLPNFPMIAQNLSQTVGSVLKDGVNAQKFQEVHSESKSWWGLSSSSSDKTTYSDLDKDFLDQMNGVVKSLYGTVQDAASFLGKDNKTITDALDSVTLREAGLDKLSFKGLSSEEAEKQLNAAFSKLGDVMAQKAMPGLEDYKKGAEGYLQTLVRVSSGVDQANYSLQKLGVTAVSYTDILNKQGDVATEIVRDSLTAKEGISGIGEIIKNMSGSVDDLSSAYQKLDKVRQTMTVAGLKNADVTTSTIRGAGGLENLSSGVEDYLDKFFSEGEKAAAKVDLLREQFTHLGVAMPQSIQDFKNLVNAQDRTTESGNTLFGALMAISGQFADVADATGNVNPAIAKQRAAISDLTKTAERWIDLQKSARSMVKDIEQALSKTGQVDNGQRINELQNLLNSGTLSFEQQLDMAGELKDLVLDKYQVEKQNAEDLIKFGKDLNKFVTDLKTGDLSPLTSKQKLEVAQGEYNQTLKDSQSSDKDIRDEARAQLQDKANTYLDLAHTYYTSSQNYKDIFSSVTGQLGNLGMSSVEAGKSINDLNQQQVDELVHLRDLAKSIDSTATSEYNATVSQMAAQVNALQSMADSLGVLSGLPEILAGLPAQLSASLGGLGVSGAGVNGTGSDQIEALYQSVLHRASDAGGKSFWQNAYNSGMTIDQIKDDFLKSDEYKSKIINGSHANGLDYVPFNGYVAELHEGESVLTATEARARRTNKAAMASTASFSSDERAEMAAEIRELRKAVEDMTEASTRNAQAVANAMHSATANAAETVVQGTKEALSSTEYDNRNKPAYQ